MAGDIQVAALYLGLSARTDKLEKDLAKAQDRTRQFTDRVGKDSKAAAATMDVLGARGEAATRKIAAGMLLASGALKTFGGDATNEFNKIIEGGAKVVAAFALGGPWLAGAVGVLEVVGAIKSEMDSVGEATRKAAKEMETLQAAITKGFLSGQETAAAMRASLEDGLLSPLGRLDRKADEIRTKIRSLELMEDASGRSLGSIGSVTEIDANSKEEFDRLRLALATLHDLRASLGLVGMTADRQGAEEATRQLAEQYRFKGEIAKLEAEIAGTTSETLTLELKLAELQERKVLLGHAGKSIAAETLADLDTEIAQTERLLGLTRQAEAAKASREASKKAMEEWQRAHDEMTRQAERAAQEIRGTWESILSPAFSGLGDVLYGALTGAAIRGSDVVSRIVNDMLRNAMNAVSQGLSQLVVGGLSSILGGSGGIGSVLGGVVSIAGGAVGGSYGGGSPAFSPVDIIPAGPIGEPDCPT